DSGEGRRDMARGLEYARKAGYAELELRAAGLLAAVDTTRGNLAAAWDLGRMGLEKYWSGPYSGLRGQQVYGNLARAARNLDQRQATYVFRMAEIETVARSSRRRTEALTRASAARAATEAGWPDEAQTQFDLAAKLFDGLQGASDRRSHAMAEMSRAEAGILTGAPRAALQRLEAVRNDAAQIDAAPDRIQFQQVLANALAITGQLDAAAAAYRSAIDLTERTLKTLREYRQRGERMLTAGPAYRGEAATLWE